MANASPLDYVDYTSIKFPSDRITLLDIRRAHPDLFDVESGHGFERTDSERRFTLNAIINVERLLARAAYENALGKPENCLGERGLERADCLKELIEFYPTYGLGGGAHLTEQWVRDIESQAASQAVGRNP